MIRPLRDHILVRPIPRAASSIIAVVLHERPNIGEIVAVGPGKWNDANTHFQETEVCVGDRVRFGEFQFKEVDDNGERLLMMREPDVAGIVEQ